MVEKEYLSWADKVAEDLISSGKKEFVCEGMWTPSGYFHIGNARPEIFTPFAVYKTLKDQGKKVKQNFVIDDFDAVRKIPSGLPVTEEQYEDFLGFPCATAPSPIPGFKTWGEAFVSDILEVLPDFGLSHLNVISAYETYKSGKLNDLITIALEKSEKIVEAWNKIAGSDKSKNFVPLQILCEECKKIYYTEVISWDGKEVEYSCKCHHTGKVSPYNGNAKLHWRVHWAAFWALNNVSFESGGKDHFSKGGSVDVSKAICREVFNYEGPYQLPTEFILLAGAKMAGSVGNVITLKDWLQVASPEVFRFLNFSYKPATSIEFSLRDNSFVLLNSRFERAKRIYYGFEQAESEKLTEKIKREFQLSSLGLIPEKPLVDIPYTFAAQLSQLIDPAKDFGKIHSILVNTEHVPEKLSEQETALLTKKLLRTRFWADKYAPQQFKLKFAQAIPKQAIPLLTENTKPILKQIQELIKQHDSAEKLQQEIYELLKSSSIGSKEGFKLLYNLFINANQGPKIGTLILALGKENILKRLWEAESVEAKKIGSTPKSLFPGIQDLNKLVEFEIDKKIFDLIPTLRLGIVVIENFDNSKQNEKILQLLRKAGQEAFLELSETDLSALDTIASWRKVYSAFGAKPKKYKSSIEALLKRVKKQELLPQINSLVDLGNVVSITSIMPFGAEDLDKIKGKIELTFAKGDEKFIPIGSEENDSPEKGEIVYKDSEKVICRRFNWRESNETKIITETKRAFAVIESLLPTDHLETTLDNFGQLVKEFCGGTINAFIISKEG